MGVEVFYTDYTGPSSLVFCDEGESPKCSDQYVFDVSISDHLNYLGVNLGMGGCAKLMQLSRQSVGNATAA